uniref:Uncharacterized protein n=1 Tax=Caenorhabditis japonica TaxID=281687 RepID=A0A8R1HJN2_CAEJA
MQKLLQNEVELNNHRIRIAKELMVKNGNFSETKDITSRNRPSDVEIRVVASDRGNSYLFQTVVFLLEQQTSKHFSFNLSICNVESKPFPDLDSFDLPIVTVGGKDGKNNRFGNNLNLTIKKENEDYWKCLGLPSNDRYILLIEDDSLVIPEFSNLLKSLVGILDFHESVDFVKLYHPNNLRKLPSYVLIITFSIMLSLCICRFFKSLPFLTFLLLAAAMSYDLTKYGSQFPAELRYKLTGAAYMSYPESCCTPAVIFRQSSIPKMIEYFKETNAFNDHAKDHILDESPFTGRQSDINYVTHIGAFSSVRHRPVFLSDLRVV